MQFTTEHIAAAAQEEDAMINQIQQTAMIEHFKVRVMQLNLENNQLRDALASAGVEAPPPVTREMAIVMINQFNQELLQKNMGGEVVNVTESD